MCFSYVSRIEQQRVARTEVEPPGHCFHGKLLITLVRLVWSSHIWVSFFCCLFVDVAFREHSGVISGQVLSAVE